MASLAGDKSLRGALKNVLTPLASIVLFCLAHLAVSTAQTQTVTKSNRKIVRNVPPEYPMIVRHAHVGGSVRLLVTVLPSGDVTKVEPLGGNAIFVESASKAVLKWKYAPAAAPSKEELQINFTPD